MKLVEGSTMYVCSVCHKELAFSDPTILDRIKKQRLIAHEKRCIKRQEMPIEVFKCKTCGKEYDDETIGQWR